MTIPQHMQAISLDGSGAQAMRWTAHPMPAPGEHEVLIRIAAAGLNRADILQRKGKYPPPPGASAVMGMEVSGVIAARGQKVQRWKIGDRVCALLAGGGYAEYCAAPESHCLPVPPNLSFIEAAVLPEAVATVYANLFEAGQLKSGATALIHGGSSGIGTMAIQLGKQAGARIFVTAGSDENCAACRDLGADLAVNYKTQDFVEAVRSATHGLGVAVVLDMIGADYFTRNLAALAAQGRHVSIATQKGSAAAIDLRDVMLRQLTITGSTLRGRSIAEKARLIEEIERRIWPMIAKKQVKALIDKVFPIQAVDQAHKRMESSAHIGKIALEVQAAL